MVLTTKPSLLTCWLFTAWLALAPTVQASHLEGPVGLDFQREVSSGSTGGFGSSSSFGNFGSFGGGNDSFSPHINCNRPSETTEQVRAGLGY